MSKNVNTHYRSLLPPRTSFWIFDEVKYIEDMQLSFIPSTALCSFGTEPWVINAVWGLFLFILESKREVRFIEKENLNDWWNFGQNKWTNELVCYLKEIKNFKVEYYMLEPH